MNIEVWYTFLSSSFSLQNNKYFTPPNNTWLSINYKREVTDYCIWSKKPASPFHWKISNRDALVSLMPLSAWGILTTAVPEKYFWKSQKKSWGHSKQKTCIIISHTEKLTTLFSCLSGRAISDMAFTDVKLVR